MYNPQSLIEKANSPDHFSSEYKDYARLEVSPLCSSEG